MSMLHIFFSEYSQKSINHVNKNAASLIAEGILDEGGLDDFNTKFNQRANAENLQKIIYAMLKSGYEESFSKIQNKPSSFEKGEFVTRTYIDQDQIIDKINEIFDDIWASREPVEILCSLDILSMSEYLYGKITNVTSSSPKAAIKITAGFDTSSLDNRDYVKLYRLINKYHMISFDFYSNESFKNGNVIVIKNKMAITCSINRLGEIYILSIITDRSAVNALYSKTESLFETQNALIESLESEKLFSKGYRTSFYASWAYRTTQIGRASCRERV